MQTFPNNSYRTLLLATLGGTLEYYDFIIFVFFATIMGNVFFPPGSPDWLLQIQTFGIFAAGYLARPLGGIIMAHFGDLRGRKQMFMLSVLLMALPTLSIGFLPSYATLGVGAPALLLLLRILQGAAIGGEVPGAWVFVAEHAPARRIGFACGMLTGGLTFGILLGSLIASAMHAIFTAEQLTAYAWRIPFLLGGVFGLIAVYLRRHLHETPVFQCMKAEKSLAKNWPIQQIIHEHRPAVIISMGVTGLLTAGIIIAILMTPTWLAKIPGIHISNALFSNSVAVLFLSLSCIGYGCLVDRYGIVLPLICGAIALTLMSYIFYMLIPQYPNWLYPMYALLGATVGVMSVIPSVMIRVFPPSVRFSGVSFSYNIAYAIFGGTTPILLTLLLNYNSLAPAHYIAAISAVSIGIGCYLTTYMRSQRLRSSLMESQPIHADKKLLIS